MLVRYNGTRSMSLIIASGLVKLSDGVEFEVTDGELKLLGYLNLVPADKKAAKVEAFKIEEPKIEEEVLESEAVEVKVEKPAKKKK